MKIVCIGDSLTYGYGVPEGAGWIDVLNGIERYTLINRGIPGNTTGEMALRFRRDALEEKFDSVLIMGGTNDVMLQQSRSATEENIAAMAREALDAGRNVILVAPIPVDEAVAQKTWFADTDYAQANRTLREYARRLENMAVEAGVCFVDLGARFMERLGERRHSFYLNDGIHVTEEGYRILAECMADGLDACALSSCRC